MQITMTKEEFDEAISKAHKAGKVEAAHELYTVWKGAYDDLTSSWIKRLGREANIEMTRRFVNILCEYYNKVKR